MKITRATCLKFAFTIVFSSSLFFLNIKDIYARDINEEIETFREYIFGIDQKDAELTFNPKFIKVIRGDTVMVYATDSSNALDALEENGYIISNDSKIVTYSEDTLANFSIIKIIKLKTKVETREIDISYSTRVYDSWQYEVGEEVIEQQGVLGVMEQKIQSYYEDGILIKEDIISETLIREPIEEVVALGSATYTLEGITERGYNCEYWYSVVDRGSFSAEEKQWLKFMMYCESGCNAESNKSFYKGLFQWSPVLWKKLYSENIFDGNAQIKHTIEKLRAGADPNQMWPACSSKYESKYGEFNN